MPDSEVTETTEAMTQTETRDVSTEETPENLLKALKAERDARKALERELKPLKTYKQEQEQAKLSEADKLKAREQAATEKEATLTTRERTIAVRDGLAAAATAEKLALNVSTATVIRLIDLDRVEFNDAGEPTNLGPLLKQLAKVEPKMFEPQRRTGSADGGAGDGPAHMNDMNARLRAATGRR